MKSPANRVGALLLLSGLLSACQGPAPASSPEIHRLPDLATAHSEAAAMQRMLQRLDHAEHNAATAARARSFRELYRAVDAVYADVWGMPSGLREGAAAAATHGWKTRWQTSYDAFDPAYAARYGQAPPAITDPTLLGLAGEGRLLRRSLSAGRTPSSPDLNPVLTPLNNVIGWQRLDDGVTKAERQPRIDLSYRWDSPRAFWQSDADTGWLFTVQAQALNILKSDYAGDLPLARQHAKALQALVKRCRDGDAHDNRPGLRQAARALVTWLAAGELSGSAAP